MKVKELIRRLSEFGDDLEVQYPGIQIDRHNYINSVTLDADEVVVIE